MFPILRRTPVDGFTARMKAIAMAPTDKSSNAPSGAPSGRKAPGGDSQQPTRPELAVLKLLWRGRPLSARSITEEVAPQFDWSYSTMRTVLERMCEKGLLEKHQSAGVNVYAAAVGKLALLSGMIRDFTDRVLELDAAPSAVMFADSKLLSDAEIDELDAMLRAHDGDTPDGDTDGATTRGTTKREKQS